MEYAQLKVEHRVHFVREQRWSAPLVSNVQMGTFVNLGETMDIAILQLQQRNQQQVDQLLVNQP